MIIIEKDKIFAQVRFEFSKHPVLVDCISWTQIRLGRVKLLD